MYDMRLPHVVGDSLGDNNLLTRKMWVNKQSLILWGCWLYITIYVNFFAVPSSELRLTPGWYNTDSVLYPFNRFFIPAVTLLLLLAWCWKKRNK